MWCAYRRDCPSGTACKQERPAVRSFRMPRTDKSGTAGSDDAGSGSDDAGSGSSGFLMMGGQPLKLEVSRYQRPSRKLQGALAPSHGKRLSTLSYFSYQRLNPMVDPHLEQLNAHEKREYRVPTEQSTQTVKSSDKMRRAAIAAAPSRPLRAYDQFGGAPLRGMVAPERDPDFRTYREARDGQHIDVTLCPQQMAEIEGVRQDLHRKW